MPEAVLKGRVAPSSLPTQKCACEDWGKGKGNWGKGFKPFTHSLFPFTPPSHESELLVTGVSRRKGIGKAIAQQLAVLGADVFILRMGMKEDKVNFIINPCS
ncbi:hypothetical protein GXM_08959 [Nostoc sphaeroides CCNUC1]|uniref:Uncharacterized protein n=1 Tax=Nostoc sphaeroides CCNUC1 TaxID=2653204 RepID=A0A5P8WF56_9NOSO|nr:hypothetical protein GXM_08959 [Nostoc sphaeroides CCNUC1]